MPLAGHFPVSVVSLRDIGMDISGMGHDWSNTWCLDRTHILALNMTLNYVKTVTPVGKENPT